MILALGRQVLYLGIVGVTPVIWFRSNEGEKLIQLGREGNFAEIGAFFANHQHIFRLLLTTGIAGITAGLSYLQLPLKLFLGWLPGVGRIDVFAAQLSVFFGAISLAAAFYLETTYEQSKHKKQ